MAEFPRLGLDFDPDFAQARAFLTALAGHPGAVHVFQTFEDRGKGEKPTRDDPRAQVIVGTFDECLPKLVALNRQRAGIFVTVNEQASGWRNNANTKRARAIWHENDGVLDERVVQHWPLEPSMVVRTRENHSHVYWLLDEPVTDWPTWHGLAQHMIEHRRSDLRCAKRAQVLRVPDFYHCKDAAHPLRVTLVQPFNGKRYTFGQLTKAFPPVETPDKIAPQPDSNDLPTVNESKWSEIVRMLDYINPDAPVDPQGDNAGTRDRWIRVLMALESTKHPMRRIVAEEWSRCGGKLDKQFPIDEPFAEHSGFVEGEVEYQMATMRKSGVGVGSIVHYARQGGYGLLEESDPLDTWELPSDRPLFVHTTAPTALRTDPPHQDFLLDGFLSGSASFSALVGRGGVGKSKLVNGIAASLASGRPAFGYQALMPHFIGGSVIVDVENEPHEFMRRFKDHVRCMIEHGQLTLDESLAVLDNVHHLHVDRMFFELAVQDHGAPQRHNKHYALLRDELMRIRDTAPGAMRWCVFDSFYKFHALGENDQGHMIYALNVLDELVSDVFGRIPRSIIHHSAKGKGASGYFDDDGEGAVRGASSITAGLRSYISVRTLSDTELKEYGIEKRQRREFAMVQVGKSNYRVMQPDHFMVRSFGSAWWYAERRIAQTAEQRPAELHTFLVRLHELIVQRGNSITPSNAESRWAQHLVPGGNVRKVRELLAAAEYERIIIRPDPRGAYEWAGMAPVLGLEDICP